MNHLKWMGHSSTVMDIQKNLRNDPESCEVTLVAKDGHSVRAHRFVLCTCSDMMRLLLSDVPNGQEATIIIPDIKGTLLDSMLTFIYMGEANLPASNLTEFLEAINILGIKSAISFECNTSALNTSGNVLSSNELNTSANMKTISGLQVGHVELLEEDQSVAEKMDANNAMADQQNASTRELEFLDVYGDQQKITYSIEHMSGPTSGSEFILTENSGTFTLTQNDKMANNSNTVEEMPTIGDEDVDETNIIEEEYSNSEDPMIEIPGNDTGAEMHNSSAERSVIDTSPSTISGSVVHIKPKLKMRAVKLKRESTQKLQQQQTNSIVPGTTIYAAKKVGREAIKAETANETFDELKDYTQDALDLSVIAVLEDGMSLQKAAAKYEVSKTVLWRRVRKNPNYMKRTREKPMLTIAYERLKSGESLKNISKELEIPMSTLHRHKVRLSQEGRLPEYIACRRRENIPKDELREKLAKAVHACVHDGMSQNQAANLFEIPKSTLWRHLQRRITDAELSQSLETDEVKEEILP